ncbi:glycoside hydrolase family 27 protein [Collybiopsis luxurians FD-317 M1]|uniref:alpha-galactosidase n=1 Tax=Collybiopsis luxurians FD-317 M1 TaxID=944289 RepID=A0A0D0CDB7_9AGAR|nr:glycoside hydrolase family 27 protein [Collybiopsis luxurians FD-317 M1]
MPPFLPSVFQAPFSLGSGGILPPFPSLPPLPPLPTPAFPIPVIPPFPVPSLPPIPPPTPPPLYSLSIGTTSNGFDVPARGWNSFGLQANPRVHPDFHFNQENVIRQCDHLASTLGGYGYTYCSLDSGWSMPWSGDKHGRVIPDSKLFNLTELADHLHSRGLHLGVYVVPGGFRADRKKTIVGTNITIGEICTGDNGLARCNWNHTMDGVQQWHNSVVNQFADWGVDFIKLDFITPGSPDNGVKLPPNASDDVIAYHRAIQNAGRPMRLDISWKLARDEKHFRIWSKNADSFRTDQDINESNSNSTLAAWATVQRAIDNYRQYIVMHTGKDERLNLYPDMDNLYVGSAFIGEKGEARLSKAQRYTIMNHWICAASNLMLGNDLTKLDATGIKILTNLNALSVAEFASNYPMRPRNPGTGLGHAQQLQAWIAGPDIAGKVVVLLANYGPDQGQGGFNSSAAGAQDVSVSWSDLGIKGAYRIRDVWKGENVGIEMSGLSASLAEGESWLVSMTPVRSMTKWRRDVGV